MRDIREKFRGETKGSATYRRVSRLELAKLVKIRSDGTWNWVELNSGKREKRRLRVIIIAD